MNYASLKTAIESYVENNFTTTDINLFITQAEQRIYNTLQIANIRKNVTGNVSADTPYLTLPNDWLDSFSLAVIDGSNNYSYLVNKDVNSFEIVEERILDWEINLVELVDNVTSEDSNCMQTFIPGFHD